ncbi:MAG TPA: hypothetical protein VJJ23_02875 [Candidatus Nanoarchaeia archaeon]|nr:hypothetical protein [Candidatus Nanoarchaeia archaeon]
MFETRKTIFNGVELPDEFSGSNVINNVAISRDGTKYAYVSRNGGLVIGQMPENGRLEIDGNVINYQKGINGNRINVKGRGVHISSFGGGSVIISGSGNYVSGNDLEFKIDQAYVNVNKVSLKESARDINLGLCYDVNVYVKGFTNNEPEYKENRLFIDGLEGTLLLPKPNLGLDIDIKTSAGEVKGDVAHKGIIRTSAGDISIDLYAPLTIEANTSAGDVNVRKMISEGRGVYSPPNQSSLGTLILETSAGDVTVNYML